MAKEFKMPVKGPGEIWMVNPAGAIHLMSKTSAANRLKWHKGWRVATAAEVEKYKAAKGKQEADKPLCPRYVDMPQEPELPDEPPAAAVTTTTTATSVTKPKAEKG